MDQGEKLPQNHSLLALKVLEHLFQNIDLSLIGSWVHPPFANHESIACMVVSSDRDLFVILKVLQSHSISNIWYPKSALSLFLLKKTSYWRLNINSIILLLNQEVKDKIPKPLPSLISFQGSKIRKRRGEF